jgi:hypothetical protein
MKFKKLNTNWNADPNAPMPEISMEDGTLRLRFLLNAFAYEHIDEGDRGTLEFYDVHMYRIGGPNDEGYFQQQFRFTNDQLPWGEFYELKQSGWETNFPADQVLINDTIDKSELSHFIFFFKDHTFECLAADYYFSYDQNFAEQAKAKYPGEYFSNFLAMFNSNFDAADTENFEAHIDLYLRLEGMDSFIAVLFELRTIQKNNDLELFLKIANQVEIANFGMDQLKDMIWVIQNFSL